MPATGDVSFFAMSVDDARVVFVADRDTDEAFELYSVPLAGGPVVKLNTTFGAPSKDVTNFLISADSARVVYLADQDSDEVFELYSVPIAGGTVTKLSGGSLGMVSGGDVLEFNISPDSARVVYRADQLTDGTGELFSVSILGPATSGVRLNRTLVGGGNLQDPPAGFSSFLVSPNSATVVYKADQDTDEKFEIYSVPIAGPETSGVKLNDTLVPAGGNVINFQVDSTSARVVYSADQGTDEKFELYSVPIAGPAASGVRLNSNLPGGAGGWQRHLITADGSAVVYVMDQQTAGVFELYSIPITGPNGNWTNLSGTLATGGDVFGIALPVGPTDGNRMTFRADKEVDGRNELFSVPIGGPNTSCIKLNTTPVAGGNVTAQGGGIYKSTVLYVADQDTDEKFEVYTIAAAGGTPIKVSGTMQPLGDFKSANFDAERVSVLADKDTDLVNELYGTRLTGGLPVKLNSALVSGGNVVQWNMTTANSPGKVVYQADQDTNDVFELYTRTFSMDSEGDGVFDRCDLCPDASDPGQVDADSNGVGDACQACSVGNDPDADGVCGPSDNCPAVANVSQADFDADGAGDACDDDDDNDGLLDTVETNTGTYVGPTNTGSNPFDADSDNDGVTDGVEVTNGTNPNSAASATPGVPFHAGRVITSTANGAYSVFAADVDGDGDRDVLSASQYDDKIAWYENNGASPPVWTPHTITTAADGAVSVFTADVDGDGDMDVLSASQSDNKIAWYENNGASPPAWTPLTISTSAAGAISVFAADVDGDGDIDALSASFDDNKIAWYENNGASPPVWTPHIISTSASGAMSVFTADVDGDGDIDVLSASQIDNKIAWYESDGASPPAWTPHTISTSASAALSVFAADVDGDGDIDALSASFLDDKIAWYENNGASPPGWTPHTISTSAVEPDSVFAADVDGDGDTDVLAASYLNGTAWYENDGASPPVWTPRTISTSAGGAVSVFAADVDGDGDVDALSATLDNNKITFYENRTIHRNASFPNHHVAASTGVAGPASVETGDIDSDGDIDMLRADGQGDTIRWLENDGAGVPGWTNRLIGPAPAGLEYAELKDLDRDGDLDVIMASGTSDTVAWYENGGGAVPTWTIHTISTSQDGPLYATAGDLDGDGDLDVVASSFTDRKVCWYRNDGGSPPAFTEFVITISGPSQNRRGLKVADMDHDGDMDIVAAVPNFGVHWYQNDGASTPVWTEGVISDAFGLTTFVDVADVNGDGDLDVVATEYTNFGIGWFESDGSSTPNWTTHRIAMSGNTWGLIFAKDMDRDGDIDLVAGSGTQAAWVENDGNDPPAWTIRTLASSGITNYAMAPGDVDGDGDVDLSMGILPAGFGHQHEWWENSLGQFSLTTTSLAPATIGNGATVPVLAIDITSNARSGDSDVELADLALRVTRGNGSSLSTEAANRLIQRVRVYLDNGSSSFELGLDTLVASVDELALAPLAIPFTAGDPRVRLAAGQSKRLFVVVETTVDASSQSPNAFKIIHDTAAGTSARDAATGAVLAIQSASSVATPTMTTTGDLVGPFVTSVFPAAGSVDVRRTRTSSRS